jgi:hypothetical protein
MGLMGCSVLGGSNFFGFSLGGDSPGSPPLSSAVGMKSWDNDDSPDTRHVYQSISEWWDTLISGKANKEQKHINGHFLYVL